MVMGAASQSFIEKSQLLESGMVGTFHKLWGGWHVS